MTARTQAPIRCAFCQSPVEHPDTGDLCDRCDENFEKYIEQHPEYRMEAEPLNLDAQCIDLSY